MDNLIAIPAVVLLFGVLVFVHELGHFVTAKLLKMKVEEFAFGFGPRLVTFMKLGETEYTLHPFPLGGYVKLKGMDPTDTNIPDGFTCKPWWKRYMVYLSGPFMSLMLAYVIFCSLGLTTGVVVPVNKADSIMKGSAAEKAGMKAGDRIVEINGHRIKSGKEMITIISSNTNKQISMEIERKGQLLRINATPQPDTRTKGRGVLGFAVGHEIRRVGFKESIIINTEMTVSFGVTMVEGIFSHNVSKNVGGPIAIFAATRESVKHGPAEYIWLMGALSLSLGVINLFPIPVVDGGQMLLLLVEGIKRKRLSPRTWEVAHQVGLAMIATIFVLVMYLDISRLASGHLLPK